MSQINILVPLAGKSKYFDESGVAFPKPLVEIKGTPMIQHTIEYLENIAGTKKFIFVIRDEHSHKFHLEHTLGLLTNNLCEIVTQRGDTKGATCSCLLAIDKINSEDELIISNGDQRIDADINAVIDEFRSNKADAGVVFFRSVHPQWSYVKFDEAPWICEAAEKKPISKNAVAGFYYFKNGRDFVWAAQQNILKDTRTNDLFFIAPVLNELILKGMRVMGVPIENEKYHSFYSWEKIKQYQEV